MQFLRLDINELQDIYLTEKDLHLLILVVCNLFFIEYACKENGVCYSIYETVRPTHLCMIECCTVIALIFSGLFLAQTRISRHHMLFLALM